MYHEQLIHSLSTPAQISLGPPCLKFPSHTKQVKAVCLRSPNECRIVEYNFLWNTYTAWLAYTSKIRRLQPLRVAGVYSRQPRLRLFHGIRVPAFQCLLFLGIWFRDYQGGETFLAYVGTHSLDTFDGKTLVSHHVTLSNLLDFLGETVMRGLKICGDSLTLRSEDVLDWTVTSGILC